MMPDYAGLFVYTKNAFIHDMVIYAKSTGAVKAGGAAAEIRNSVIDKVRIYGTVKGGTAGGVAGEAYNSKIINSSFGHINYNTSDYIFPSELIPYAMAHRVASDVADAGGIAGGIHESRIVSSTVCGEISTDTGTAGGIAGSMEASEIENTLHCGRVSGAAAKIGGLAGRALNSRIITSYSDSVVSASKNNSAAGGISGESVNTPVENSVAVGIAVTGEKAGRIIGEGADAADGYARLDMLVNGTHVDNGGKDGTGIPLAALKNGESFFRDINWDFRLVWEIPEYYKYPRIEWESDTLSRFTEIASVRELMELTEAVIAPTDSSYDIMKSNLARGGWYVLTKDMDLAEAEWRSIGTDTEPFYGVFYGNGKKIMNISDSLFDYTEGLRVYDLDLVNANGKKDGILAGKIGRRGKLENIKVTGKGESRGGLAGNISGEVEISYSSFSGELLLNAGNSDGFSGGIAASMAGGILAYSSTAGIAGVRSGITTDTSMAAAVGGLVGSASNILASNNYSSMDVYATGGRSGSGGGLFGVLSYSTVADSYASGSVYAATRYYFVPNLLTPMAGGIIGYAEDSDIRSVAYLGNAVSTEHYDVRNAEGYAGNITGRNINTGFLKVYSNSAVVLTAERTAGEMGTPIDLESVTESFYTAELKLNFEDIWKMPISGICPVFKRQ
jgi:hypothetical protein